MRFSSARSGRIRATPASARSEFRATIRVLPNGLNTAFVGDTVRASARSQGHPQAKRGQASRPRLHGPTIAEAPSPRKYVCGSQPESDPPCADEDKVLPL